MSRDADVGAVRGADLVGGALPFAVCPDDEGFMRLANGPDVLDGGFDDLSPACLLTCPASGPCLLGDVLSVGLVRPVNSRFDFEPSFCLDLASVLRLWDAASTSPKASPDALGFPFSDWLALGKFHPNRSFNFG